MREGYGSLSGCLSVCYQANCYIPSLYIENKVPLGFLWHFQHMHCACADGFCFVQKFWRDLLLTTTAFFAS